MDYTPGGQQMTTQSPFLRASLTAVLVLYAGAFPLAGESPVTIGGTNAPAREQPLSAVAQIVFRGTSTLHDFEGRVTTQPFALLLATNAWSAQAEVFGGEMTTANDRRDRNMWMMLDTNTYPRLSGAVRNAPYPPPGGTNILLSLRIRGHQLDLPVTIANWSETPDAVRFHAEWILSLKDYGLKSPSVLGIIRVGDTVRLSADVTATKSGSATGSSRTSSSVVIQP